MASPAAITVVYGFTAVSRGCLQLPVAPETEIQEVARGVLGLLAAAVVATLVLTQLLLYAHLRELRRASAGVAGAGSRLVAGLTKATLVAATVALFVSDAVVQLGADGHLDRGRDDVARLNIK